MTIPDEQTISDFVHNFLGYGELHSHPNSSIWLVGPEAGGGQNLEELHKRATVWSERGRCATEDLQEFHAALKLPPREDWSKKIQGTWGALIRILLAFEGKAAETKSVLNLQLEELGRRGGGNAILDLSQLSTRSMKDWSAHGSEIPWLKNREAYEAHVLPRRRTLFAKLFTEHDPALVLFFGKTYQSEWEKIAQVKFAPTELPELSFCRTNKTLFAMIPHPNGMRPKGKGAKNKLLAELGSVLREMKAK